MTPCRNLILWVDARRRGSGKPYKKAKESYSWWSAHLGAEVPKEAVPCTGTVKVKIELGYDYGGCCGGSHVEITYECDTCKSHFYPELPQGSDSLAEFLSGHTVISKTKGKEMAKEYAKQRAADDLRTQKMIADMRARRR